jgi:diadenylate cyclase
LFREGLENIRTARIGATIVISDESEITDIIDGGFYINKEFNPAMLYELAKMDSAIIVSKNLKRIIYANSLLIPDPAIETSETGTRHKSAQRTAKQTGSLVICISQRRNFITLYKGNEKYVLSDTQAIVSRANQALQTLEKYNVVMNSTINNLNLLEIDDLVTLDVVVTAIRRVEMVMRIVDELNRYLTELGYEGRLIGMQVEEILRGSENAEIMIFRDYMQINNRRSPVDSILNSIRALSYFDLSDPFKIAHFLGFTDRITPNEISVTPRGYRMLSKIPKLHLSLVNKIVDKFGSLSFAMSAKPKDFMTIDGIAETKANSIYEGLKRIKDQLFVDSRYI